MLHAQLYLIGLTGGIACGKSTVLAILAELGAHTIDTDLITHRLQQPNTPVYKQIVATFGPDILSAPNAPIDRRKLGSLVFNNPQALQQLEHIVHPAVHSEIMAWIDGFSASLIQCAEPSLPRTVVVIDAVKLLEAGWKEECNAIWVVTCSQEQQIERLQKRQGMSEIEARQRISAQLSQAIRVAHADVIIDNSASVTTTRNQIVAAWAKIHQTTS